MLWPVAKRTVMQVFGTMCSLTQLSRETIGIPRCQMMQQSQRTIIPRLLSPDTIQEVLRYTKVTQRMCYA